MMATDLWSCRLTACAVDDTTIDGADDLIASELARELSVGTMHLR